MRSATKLILPLALIGGLAAPGHAQVKLERKFQENEKAAIETTTTLQQTLSINGMDIDTQSEQTVTVQSETGKRQGDGTLPLMMTIQSMKANINLPGGISANFDSEAPAAKEENPTLAMVTDIFKAMVGSTYTINLDKDGKAVSVAGVEKSLDKARNLNPQAAEALEGQLNTEAIKSRFNEELAKFPAKPVNKGETWTGTDHNNLGGGQSLTYERTYEYLGTVEKDGKTLDKIGVKATSVKYAMDSPNSPVKVSKSDLKVESSEGTILFDREAGYTVSEHIRTQITGTMTLDANGQEIPANLDLTIEQNETVTPK
jgi:hypothetical protein